MYPWLARIGVAVVFGLLGFGAGSVHSDKCNEAARAKQNAENERLRQMLRSVLSQFAESCKNMEEAIVDLLGRLPTSVDELAARLAARNMPEVQIQRIVSKVRESGFLGA